MSNRYAYRLPQIFEDSFKKYSERVAIDYDDTLITYKQLEVNVNKWVKELSSSDIDIASKTRVLLVVNHPIEFITIWLALWKMDCITIPIEGEPNSEELSRAIRASECNMIIASSHINLDGITTISKKNSLIQPSLAYFYISGDAMDDNFSDPALFFYTSGTTGLPKCVVFNHHAMAENVMSVVETIEIDENDKFFTPLSPMLPATLATAVLPALSVGASLVLSRSSLPGSILKKIGSKEITVFFAVPYIYELLSTAMSSRSPEIWKKVRLCLTSSALLENHTFDSFYKTTLLPIRSIYCSSEGGAVTYNDTKDIELIRNSVGRLLPGVKIKILNDKLQEVGRNEIGEIYVGGSHLSSGYYNQPQLQQSVFREGWIKTGDLGRLDDEEYLILSGRSSETINISGFLVNPEEVEQVIAVHPFVAEAMVYGMKDSKLGETIAVKIVLKDVKNSLTVDELYNYCSERLKHYKIPRHIEFVTEIPKSRYGKKARGKLKFVKGGQM